MNETTKPNTNPIKRMAIIAVVALVVCALAWWVAPQCFFMAWLAAAMLPWSISVGSLALMLIFCLTGGRWAEAAWPWLTINARMMPLIALLFVPWLFGIETIYPWANSDVLTQFESTENRQWLFQTPFFMGRTVFYFGVWSLLSFLLAGLPWSKRKSRDSMSIIGGQAVAGLGLIAILLTSTWAGVDWVMSFDPFFTSTLFGALIGIGAMLAALSATVVAVCFWKPLHAASIEDKAMGDLSSLLLAFLMLWAYFSFAHFLIMWSGDLPIEANFYVARNAGAWRLVTPTISIGGFVVPFLCLLSHDFKRSPRKVGRLALFLLVVRMVELWWMVSPASGDQKYGGFHWAMIPATVAVVAIYVVAAWCAMQRVEGSCRAKELINENNE